MKNIACFTFVILALALFASTRAVPATIAQSRPWVVSQASNICVTPVVMCYLPGYAPSGSPCWCNTPYGPVNGRVR